MVTGWLQDDNITVTMVTKPCHDGCMPVAWRLHDGYMIVAWRNMMVTCRSVEGGKMGKQ